MLKRFSKAFMLASLMLLISCFGPEKFTLKISIKKNGDYSYNYKGTIVYIPAAAALKEGKTPKDKIDAELNAATDTLKKDKTFKSVKYISNGRYEVEMEQSGNVLNGKVKIALDLVTIEHNKKNSTIEVRGTVLQAKDIAELNKIGIKIDGEVKVETDADVVSASVDKSFFGGYKWVFKKASDVPVNIVIKAKQ